MTPTFFATPEELRAWFEQNHATEKEFMVGYYKKGTGIPSITWEQSVDQALCYGWIDGVRKSLGETSYMIRFTPRKTGSIWSAVNIKRVGELTADGLMQPAGLKAFEARKAEKSEVYAYEQESVTLSAEFEAQLKANDAAWTYFEAQAPWYKRGAIWWVMSAKQEATRHKRLATLIDDSAGGRPIPHLRRYG